MNGTKFLAAAALAMAAIPAMSQRSIIPQPQLLAPLANGYELTSSTGIKVVGKANATAELIRSSFGASTGFSFPADQPGIVIKLDKEFSYLGPEGYKLRVSRDGVMMASSTNAGLFYAFQSLRQLLPPEIYGTKKASVEWKMAGVEIEDHPRFSYRGAMLDTARHFFPKDYVKKFIDTMAVHKLNTFHWHLTDDQGWRIEIKRYPKLTSIGAFRKETMDGRHPGDPKKFKFDGIPHGGFYTQEDIKEVVKYAQERNITIVPEIEMPGHAQAAIAAYPELGGSDKPLEVLTYWGVNDNVFNTKPSTIKFLQNVLVEVMALFPGQFIHVGGDECPKVQWKNSPEAQAQIKQFGLKDEHELQSWFIRQMDTFIASKGRRLIGWDEILEGGLAPGATVMAWRGTSHGIAAAKAGHDVVMAPNSYFYLDYYQSKAPTEPLAIGGFLPLDRVYSYDPIPAEFTAEQASHVIGAQAQLWTEYIKDGAKVDYMLYPRLCAVSEVCWSDTKSKNFAGFVNRLTDHSKRLDQLKVNYRPYVYEAGALLGNWKSGGVSSSYRVQTWTIPNKLVTGKGNYRLVFQYTSGGQRLDIEWVEILVNGQLVVRKDQYGVTGAFDKDNVYNLTLPDVPAGAKIELRANVKADGGTDSNGDITLTKV